MIFGNTIRETIESFSSKKNTEATTFSAGTSTVSGTEKSTNPVSPTESVGRIIVSILLILVAVYLLVQDNKSQSAIGLLGAIGGYWLK